MQWLMNANEALSGFMDLGGNVLWLIAILLFFMWMLIFERIWYFRVGWKQDVGAIIAR